MIKKSASILYPEKTINRKPPISLKNDVKSEFIDFINCNFKRVNLYKYNNVNVTPEGILFRGIKLDEDLLIYPHHNKIYNWLYLVSTYVKRKKISLPPKEKYLLCTDYWSDSIFHWACDVLPRLESIKELAKDCVLLLPKHFSSNYIRETLKAYRFKSIYEFDSSTYLKCETLFCPEQITISGQINPESICNVRNTLLIYFKPKFTNKLVFKNIYISRSKARFRKVLNENEILPILEKYNFKVINFEDYSVAEQIEICYNTKNMVSIHGANLTNSIFIQPNNNILEFRMQGDLLNNYYYELADSINCNYYYLECDFLDPKPHTNTFDLTVNKNDFENLLQIMLNKNN